MGSESAGRAAIEARIPHRAPFLLLDEIVAEGADWIETRWRVPADLDVFRGHYPGSPLLPGVLTAEMCIQSAAVLLGTADDGATGERDLPVLARISEARFRRVVRPGETLQARVELVERLQNARYMRGVVKVGGETALRLGFVVAAAAPASIAPLREERR